MTAPRPPTPLRRLWLFISDGMWRIDLRSLSRSRGFGLRTLRTICLMFHGFMRDECPLRASALTFTTLMALVPMLALSLSLARVFGGEEIARTKITTAIQSWTEHMATASDNTALAEAVDSEGAPLLDTSLATDLGQRLEHLVDYAFDRIELINFAAIGWVGLMFLIWIAIDVLAQIETSFNRVWGVTVGRTLWRRTADYFTLLLILPILVLAASSLPVFEILSGWMQESPVNRILTCFGPDWLHDATTFCLTTLCFTFILRFMPNTRVAPSAGLAGGVIAALLFIGCFKACAAMQTMAIGYGRLYGSFAIIPLLLAWLYLSWNILLFSAEAAFAFQNSLTYPMEQGSRQAGMPAKLLTALTLVTEAARAMHRKDAGIDLHAFARERGTPVRLVNDTAEHLFKANLLGELAGSRRRCVLMRPPNAIPLREVASAVIDAGLPPEALGLKDIDEQLRRVFTAALAGFHGPLEGLMLSDLMKDQPITPSNAPEHSPA
jgi:membrane protein